MRVFFINSVCGTGSTGRLVTELCRLLTGQGDECKIAYGIGQAICIDEKYTIKIGGKLNYYLHNLLSRFTDRAGLYSRIATKRLIKKIKIYNPDLIHIHNIHGYYLNIKILFNYLSILQIPIVWTLHDCWAFTGHCTHFSYVNCDKWIFGCESCQQKNRYPQSLFLDRSKENYMLKKALFTSVHNMHIVTPSKWLASGAEQSFLHCYPIIPINNGIDLDVFKYTPGNFRSEYGIEDKIILLGVANAWNDRKGLLDFIALSKKIGERFAIVLVGLTESQITRLPKNIIGISRTQNVAELAMIYSAADIFLNLSYEETFGLVTVEALACETPVISYNKTAVPEIINSQCGLIIPAGDIDLLNSTIMNFPAFDSEKIRAYVQLYDIKKMYQKYIRLYTELISGQNKGD